MRVCKDPRRSPLPQGPDRLWEVAFTVWGML